MTEPPEKLEIFAGNLLDLLPPETRTPELFLLSKGLVGRRMKTLTHASLLALLQKAADQPQEQRVSLIGGLVTCALEVRTTAGLLLDFKAVDAVFKAADAAFGCSHSWPAITHSSLVSDMSGITLRQVLVTHRILRLCLDNVSDPSASTARELQLTEPDVSKIFSQVEKKLGVQLRTRTGRGPRGEITEVGKQLYPAFQEMAAGVARLAWKYWERRRTTS